MPKAATGHAQGAKGYTGYPTINLNPCITHACSDLVMAQVVWTAGSTQGGSSGAALVDLRTRRIIGVLTGGFASCLQPQAADYFGRVSVVRALCKRPELQSGVAPS